MSRNKAIVKLPLIAPMIIGVIWAIYSLQYLNQGIFWDLGIYQKAVTVFNEGGNPYELGGYLSFVYQPLVLRGMALFGTHLSTALILGYIASLLFFLRSLGSNTSWWLYSFLAFAYCGAGTISIGSGNVTVFCHLILLGFLLHLISNEKRSISNTTQEYFPFILSVVVFGLIKPYMLAYLLIPIVLSWKSEQQKSTWALILLAGILSILVPLISSLYFAFEFQSFLAALQGQTIGKHDLGYGLLMYFYEYYSSAGHLIYRAFVLHFTILAALILTILILGNQKGLTQKPIFALLLYFLLTILNPRLKIYDLFPALLALFIYASTFGQSSFNKGLFIIAYILSLAQLPNIPFLSSSGALSNPLNVYYLTMTIIMIGVLSSLLKNKSLNN
jgi:hypothetical protein